MNQNEGIFQDYHRRVAELEQEIAGDAAEVEIALAAGGLREHPDWKPFAERLAYLRDSMTEAVIRKNLDPHALGYHQGVIRTLRQILNTKPIDQEEVERIKQGIRQKQEQLEEIRLLFS